jgi:hypothetical protein
MSILIEAYHRLLTDVREVSRVPLGTPDDITYDWVLTEGPKLDKQILMFLEGLRLEKPEIPEWLTPLWDKFIVTNDGLYLRYIRCLLVFCYKAELPPNDKQIKEAQASFEEVDYGCSVWDLSLEGRNPNTVLQRSARRIISRITSRIDWLEIVPSHGPGSVYPTCPPDEKSRFDTYYPSIQRYYPYDKYLWCLPSFWHDIMVTESKGSIKEKTDIVAKLVAVPKDSRGPRLICVHPKEAIWIQQGQRKLLEASIERSPLTRGKINFTDQTVNGSLALSSSIDRKLVTLDLKEASDRISATLVKSLFGDYTYDVLSCARANKIKLLDGRVIPLYKWAPMGNCLTFPVQSLIFYSLVVAGIKLKYGMDCTDVYVFGDDILFPAIYYDGAFEALVKSGLVPNHNKTFRRGFFRESCGVDAYSGIDVTPLRMRKADVVSAQDALATVDLAKRLRQWGFEHCSSYLYKQVAKRFGKLPFCNNPMAQGLFEYVDRDLGWILLNEPRVRYRTSVQQFSVPIRQVKAVLFEHRFRGDWYHLLDSLHRIALSRSEISDRGTEYPVPYRAQLTYGWADCHYGN